MEVIRHPGSVVLLPQPSPREIILIRQYRYTLDRYIWELPAGSLKPGEDPDVAAARECEEEIGLAPARVERLQGFYPTPGFCDELMIYYRCTELGPPAPAPPRGRTKTRTSSRARSRWPRRARSWPRARSWT
jgi:ADP-ribose pyrophosphatase